MFKTFFRSDGRKGRTTLFLLMLLSMLAAPFSASQAQDTSDYPSMAGKTALVTGSTDGLGREVALRLGALGAHVIVHGRSVERGTEVVEQINAGPGSAEFMQADFGRLANVRTLAEQVQANHDQLHLLINNAGIGSGFAGGERTLSEDGYEMIFQVNHLAHYLLTDLLLPTLEASAPARIINVASGAQRPILFDDVMLSQDFDPGYAYAQSKLAQILHSNYLAPQLIEHDITINSLHPATMMDTTLVSQMPGPARTTVDEGAVAVMNLAASAALDGVTGGYYSGLDESRSHDQSHDPEALERFDELSRTLLERAPSLAAHEYMSLSGKTVLITGGTDGMGREVAQRLGLLGAHVIVHGRNAERGAEVVAAINAGPGSAEFQQADFANLDNVREMAEAVIADHEQIHLLINNAGISSGFADGQRTLSEDGYEMLFQVNYLAHYLLTDLLLPTIKASAPARIVNVASGAQRPVDFDDVMMAEGEFNARDAYGQSKLAQILHTFHMADDLAAHDITFTTLHPATRMDTTMVAMSEGPVMSTVDEGATALMHLAAATVMDGRTGIYFRGLEPVSPNDQAYDAQARERLDALSRDLVGLD